MRIKGMGATALAGALALSLIAAGSATATPVGTAQTALTAVSISVEGGELAGIEGLLDQLPVSLLDLQDLSIALVEGETFATTDAEATEAGTPRAVADLVAAVVGGQDIGRVSASSDADRQDSAGAGPLLGLPIPGSFGGASATAEATATSASALLDAAVTGIADQLEVVDVTVEPGLIESTVGQGGATASQSVASVHVGVDLGALLPEDLLELLPLANLLAIIDELDLATGQLDTVLGQVAGAVGDLEGTLAGVTDQITTVDGMLGELSSAQDALPVVEQLTTFLAANPVGGSTDETLDLGDVTGTIGDTVDDIIGGLGGGLLSAQALDCSIDALDPACAEALLLGLVEPLVGDTSSATALADLEGLIDDLLGALPTEISDLVAQLTTLDGDLSSLIDVLGLLDTSLLDQLADLLGGLDATELVGLDVTALQVGAAADAEGAEADASCEVLDITILGSTLPVSCEDIDGTLDTLTGAVDQAVGQLGGLLSSLTGGAVQVTGTEIDVLDRTVTVDDDASDGVTSAEAIFNLLHVVLPSVTIDATGLADGLLGQLGLPSDLDLGAITDQLDTLVADLGTVAGLPGLDGLSGSLTTLTGAVDGLDTGLGGLDDVIAIIEGLLGQLGLDALGTLPRITTPTVTLDVDPTSAVEFAAAAAPAAPSDGDGGAPLPVTGGGMALLALAALGGAASLGRRPARTHR